MKENIWGVKFRFGLLIFSLVSFRAAGIMHREMDNVHCTTYMHGVCNIHTVWRRKSQEHELHDLQC